MGVPHKHAELIKAWADGAEIEYKCPKETFWYPLVSESPCWFESTQYRIRPPKKTPGQVYFEAVYPKASWELSPQEYKNCVERGAKAVIESYKRGEFDEDCNC